MEEDKSLSFHRKSKRGQHMKNKSCVSPKIYNTNKEGFKAMVLRLTAVVPPSSLDLSGILPPPPPLALHPQPVISNTARFPPLPYRYLTLPTRNNAVNIPIAQSPNSQPSAPSFLPPLPPQYQSAPANISTAELSNVQPPLWTQASPFLPPLPPQYSSLNISSAELPNFQPPPSATAPPFLPPLPPQYSSAPRIDDVDISAAELSNAQPPPPSATAPPFLPPLPPQYSSVPTINDVNISAAELSNAQPPPPPPPPPSPLSQPSPLAPPPSPREQDSAEDSLAAFMHYFESCMTEDDSTEQRFSAWSPFHDTTMISDGEQQQQQQPAENVPSPAPMTLPSASQGWSNPTYDLPPTPATLPSTNLDWSSNFTYDSPLPSMNLPDGMVNYPHHLLSGNVPTPIPVTSPYENLLSWHNSQNENIPPPAILPSEMVPPATLPFGNYQNTLPSEDISPPLPTDLPSWSHQYWPNHPNDQRSENIPPPVPMGLSSSGSQPGWPDSQNGQIPGMVPPLVPATLPFGNYQNDPRSQAYIAQSGFATVPSWSLDWDSYPSVLRTER